MPQKSGIEWTDVTWNPVTGCTRVSSGCDHCYAATLANRLLKDVYRARLPVVDSDITRRDPFAVRLWPERLDAPLRWRDPHVIFVTSSVEAVRSMVADGLGVTILSDMVYRPWSLEGQRIEQRNLLTPIPTMDVGLAWNKSEKLGRAARAFAELGSSIGLVARGRDGLEAARRDVEARGGRGLVLPVDVSDAAAVESAAATVEQTFGPIDVWVNNAMLSVFSPV